MITSKCGTCGREYVEDYWGNSTGYTQKTGAVSSVNKKFISHLTRAQRTSSSSSNCPSFSCATSMLTAELVSKMASQQEKAVCVLRFEVSRFVITVQREFRARFRKDAPGRCKYKWHKEWGITCRFIRYFYSYIFTEEKFKTNTSRMLNIPE